MTTKNYIASWCKSFRLPGVHEDYDEEDLEKDDYHYEDDN